MADEPDRKLEYRLVHADGAPPDVQVIDDLIRLIRQGIATAPKEYPQVANGSDLWETEPDEKHGLANVEAKVKHRIAQASADCQAAVEERAKISAQPDAERQLAERSRKAAELVVAAVQRALLRGVRVQVPDDPTPTPDS